MTQHTRSEWIELWHRLNAIATDPDEERDRRQRAMAIMETVPREFRAQLRMTTMIDDLDVNAVFDGRIV